MKRKITVSMCFVAAFSVIITTILISYVLYRRNYERLKNNIQTEAMYMAEAMDYNGVEYLDSVKDVSPSRITWISQDGTVLFDNSGREMNNHSNRPEFIEATTNGLGYGSRLSNTLQAKTYYYAIQLDDGTVLRVSNTTSSLFEDIFSSLPYVVFVSFIILAIACCISGLQTKRIVKPINEMDLNNPKDNIKYDELAPLLLRIEKQNNDISDYISQLKYKQAEFNTVTENMSEGLIIVKGHNVLSINKSASEILKCSCDYEGKNILEINNNSTFIQTINRALGGQAGEVNLTIDNKNYMIIVNPVKKNNTISGAVILLIDVTEKNSREALRREFSANVSHELKTPLTTISGYAEIMMEGLARPEDYKKFSGKIYNEAKRLVNLIEDIVNLSRLDEGIVSMPYENVDLLELSTNISALLARKIESKNLKFAVSGVHAVVSGVSHILNEMIFNLCDNAIKYNKIGGSINVSIKENDENVIISVEDSGIGIPPEDTERIFERFYCVDKSHSKETGGTGLGLSIVKHGAAFHNARISVNSVLGKGTTMTITFNKNKM